MPKVNSVDQYIKNDIRNIHSRDSTIIISKSDGYAISDQIKWQSYTFFPKKEGFRIEPRGFRQLDIEIRYRVEIQMMGCTPTRIRPA